MKNILYKLIKTLLFLVILIFIIYFLFTFIAFYRWCNQNYIPLFINQKNVEDYIYNDLDSNYIEGLGKSFTDIKKGLEDSLSQESDTIIAKKYDSVGYAVWAQYALQLNYISTKYIPISIILGIVITSAYIIIKNEKINNITKFIIGYIGVIIFFPPIYMYSWTYRFWSFKDTYLSFDAKLFYIVYLVVFVILFVVNYFINKKIAIKLNKQIYKKDE